MPTLFDGLRSAVNALRTTGEALAITQMNMTNAGVAGYARVNVNVTSDGFDPSRGMAGGMHGSSASARSQYAEQSVWSQTSQKGFFESFTQSANGVDSVLGLTDITGQSGIQGMLGKLYQSFAKLQTGTTDPVNQEDVVQKARAVALTISQTADFVQQSSATAQSRIQATVEQINGLVKGLQQWNSQLNESGGADPLAEAQVYAALEELSTMVPITAQKQADGGLSILLNGQIPLVQGSQLFPLRVSFEQPPSGSAFPDAPAQIRILNAANEDITSTITNGELGGLLDYTNRFAPSLLGDADQQGNLNRLAQGIADSVNAALGGSTPMFTYDSNPANVARSLRLSDSFTRTDLATAISGDPAVRDNLTRIARGDTLATQIDGQSYAQFFLTMSARSATEFSRAQDGVDLQDRLVNQAKGFREKVQGASVEQAAIELLQYQRAFEAAAKVIGVIDELTETTLDMVR